MDRAEAHSRIRLCTAPCRDASFKKTTRLRVTVVVGAITTSGVEGRLARTTKGEQWWEGEAEEEPAIQLTAFPCFPWLSHTHSPGGKFIFTRQETRRGHKATPQSHFLVFSPACPCHCFRQPLIALCATQSMLAPWPILATLQDRDQEKGIWRVTVFYAGLI